MIREEKGRDKKLRKSKKEILSTRLEELRIMIYHANSSTWGKWIKIAGIIKCQKRLKNSKKKLNEKINIF